MCRAFFPRLRGKNPVAHALRFCLYVLRAFGIEDFKAHISTMPEEKAAGSPEEWERTTEILRQAVDAEGIDFEYDVGGGAFYGPKIDLKSQDALGREWQLSTVQFDFNLPERFELEYAASDGLRHRPMMVHRAQFGSAERFFGLLIEHYRGAFPLWLAPVQVVVLPIASRHADYGHEVMGLLEAAGVRVQLDADSGRLSHRIRTASTRHTPSIAVVGDKEAETRTIAVRARGAGDLGQITIPDSLASIEDEGTRVPERV